MRILIWTDAFWPEIGGLEVFCMRLATALKDRGHECEIIANRRENISLQPDSYRGIPIHGFHFQGVVNKGDLAIVRAQLEGCVRVIERFKPEVIHLNAIKKSVLFFMLQQRQQRLPAVMTLHDHLLLRSSPEIGAAVFDNVDLLAAISQYMRSEVVAYDRKLEGKLRTVLNALPAPKTIPTPLPREPRILGFGRLSREKGFDVALQAFAHIANLFPEATLTLAGDGDERSHLEMLAKKSGWAHRIHFPGWVFPDQIPDLLNRHSLVIIPSRWKEPFGLVALQTAQMGRPVIASRTGALPEIIVDGETGKLFENESVASLTEALRFFLERPERGIQMGNQAALHVREHFAFDRFVAAYENLYLEAQNIRMKARSSP